MNKLETETVCPACGARHVDTITCQDDFYQMLYWESELMAEGADLMDTHFLMVACYHLQHPHLYSSETLAAMRQTVADFLAGRRTLNQIRSETREAARSDKRQTTITAREDNEGGYATSVAWTLRAADVIAAGKGQYVVSGVRQWAETVIVALEGVEVVRR